MGDIIYLDFSLIYLLICVRGVSLMMFARLNRSADHPSSFARLNNFPTIFHYFVFSPFSVLVEVGTGGSRADARLERDRNADERRRKRTESGAAQD